MENVWELFEELDEMVYVSDPETHELVYMNRHLREALGYGTHEEYRGKPCHQILQGSPVPCSFCNTQQLRIGTFVSWTHKNPVLHKCFLVKDSLIQAQGKTYRMEIAIDADPDSSGSPYYARSETILNQCMQHMFSSTNPEQSIQRMLTYIGTTFSCDRAYIFELSDNQTTSNTYEWCAENVTPQKDLLQNVSVSGIDWWMALFADHEATVIPDLENIRLQYPESYAVLKPQDIHSLAAGPIHADGKIIGFLGVDNPDRRMLPLVAPLLTVIGYFTSTLLKRRDLLARLHELSYHDQLTGALNRHALSERLGNLQMDSVGVLYCDITGLKAVNDSLGHAAGDQLICRCYDLLRETTNTSLIYRTGGDEFIALYPNCGEIDFQNCVCRLQRKIREESYHVAVGYVWSDTQPLNLEKLIAQADQVMYRDKRDYYEETLAHSDSDHRQLDHGTQSFEPRDANHRSAETPFQTFLTETNCDMEALFHSVSQDNDSSYFYLGDMQKDLFFISDNMKEDFGFPQNLVPGLLKQWSKRISTPEFQDLFWQDISSMLREKRTIHDLRYQVRDVNGNNLWIRCYGILKWNEDKSKPLFFSGRVTHQDKNFVVDPITNFPREHASFQQLDELRRLDERALVIGFSLNGFSEINTTKGRAYGDRLLKNVADALTKELFWKMSFFRLEGMRCMAVVNSSCMAEGQDALVEQIRAVIQKCYASMDVSVQNFCSFGIMEYPNGAMTPDDLVENLVSLIRVAKQDARRDYVDYSTPNIQRIKQMSNMVLALSQNVANQMEHFRIVIQPIVSAADGAVIGGEVLLRWTFEGKDVSPATFIPILEKIGLIHTVGRWVFEQATSTCVRLQSHDPAFYLTFNMSLHQLSDPQLLPFMKETLEKYRLSGSSLVAELTESCLDEQPEKLTGFVQACQKLGISIALDDFGSGYSSLRMLLQYPSSIIKLDRSLVREMAQSTAKMHFIQSIVFACHQFGKTVCMEGVESAEQNEMIRNTGCDMIQGYYHYRPMELSQMYHLVSQTGSGKQGKEASACRS